jgi:hypothetical protein
MTRKARKKQMAKDPRRELSGQVGSLCKEPVVSKILEG